VKLAEEMNHIFLGRCFVFEARPHLFPNFLDAPITIHQSDEEIGSWSETLKSSRGMVLKNIPELSTILMTMNLHMTANSRS